MKTGRLPGIAAAGLCMVWTISCSKGDSSASGDGGPEDREAASGGATAAGGNTGAGAQPEGGRSSARGGRTGSGGAASPTGCMAGDFLADLGSDHLMVGGSMSDETASSAPFDGRYLYLAGGTFDGDSPCARCDTGCTTGGTSCANSAGCNWWGCWQWDQDPPGAYARDFFDRATSDGQVPLITYYLALQASGATEGPGEVLAAREVGFMRRYLADFRFLVDQIGSRRVLVHIEPDFWGYAQHQDDDPHAIPAAVASAHPDCAGFDDSIAGLGRCMVSMVHRFAPNARVGLHASGWGTRVDALGNRDGSLDVEAEARKLGAFMAECGAGEADFVVVDAADRDAGWRQTQGEDTWWDDTNATLPNFRQGFTWARALAERIGRPIVWWQVPVGNMALPNTHQAYQDNRVDYFMTHLDEVRDAHGAAVFFGGGDGDQTTPDTDGGNLVSRVRTYATERAAPCP